MKSRFLYVILILAFCAAGAMAQRQDIDKQNASYAALTANRDAVGVSNIYTEDSQLLQPGGAVVYGRQAILAFFQSTLAGGANLQTQVSEVLIDGKTAVETGTYSVGSASGKYMIVWKKVKKNWLRHRHIWN